VSCPQWPRWPPGPGRASPAPPCRCPHRVPLRIRQRNPVNDRTTKNQDRPLSCSLGSCSWGSPCLSSLDSLLFAQIGGRLRQAAQWRPEVLVRQRPVQPSRRHHRQPRIYPTLPKSKTSRRASHRPRRLSNLYAADPRAPHYPPPCRDACRPNKRSIRHKTSKLAFARRMSSSGNPRQQTTRPYRTHRTTPFPRRLRLQPAAICHRRRRHQLPVHSRPNHPPRQMNPPRPNHHPPRPNHHPPRPNHPPRPMNPMNSNRPNSNRPRRMVRTRQPC